MKSTLKPDEPEIASQEGVSINQFISSAVSEKISAISTENYLTQRAQRANRDEFTNILNSVPARTPIEVGEIQETKIKKL